jgi:putative membrane protein
MLVSLLVNALAVFVTAQLLPGIEVKNFLHAIFVAIVLGILNACVKPILIFFSLPVTFLTLGLFLLVINGFIIMMTSWFLSGFKVNGFGWAVAFSLVLWIVNGILEWIVGK